MTYIAFYWLCAGLANHRMPQMSAGHWALDLTLSLMFGGVAIPVRILAKLAS